MKTQVNHHHQLNAVAVLISVSILLLAFGIYKTIQFQEKEMFKSYTYTSELATTPNEVAKNHSLSLTNELFENEETLEIESWMLDYSTWLTKPTSTASTYSTSTEETLEIKDWMLNTSEWLVPATSNIVLAEYEEEALVIEDWMLSTNDWVTTNHMDYDMLYEEDLELESWMLSTKNWEVPLLTEDQWNEINFPQEEELVIKDWMIQCCTWITSENMNEAELYDFNQNIIEESLTIEAWMTDLDSWLIDHNNTNTDKKQG